MGADRILSQLLGSNAATGLAGGIAGGLASGLLTSKAGRKLGKKALKMGGIAAIGGLAYAAFAKYRQNQALAQGAPLTDGVESISVAAERFIPAGDGSREAEALGLTLLRAMVAAAQADGRLDGRERHAIYERVGSLDLSEADKAELLAQLNRPIDMSGLVATAGTPEIAAEIYTASLLAIDLDTPAERAYLAMLAARLGLPEELVASIHRELEVPDVGERTPALAPGVAS